MLPAPEPKEVAEAVQVADELLADLGPGVLQGDQSAFAAPAGGAGEIKEGIGRGVAGIAPALEASFAGLKLVNPLGQPFNFLQVDELTLVFLG